MHLEKRFLDGVFRVGDVAEVVVGDAFHAVTVRAVNLLEDAGVTRGAGPRETKVFVIGGARRSNWSLGGNHWAR